MDGIALLTVRVKPFGRHQSIYHPYNPDTA